MKQPAIEILTDDGVIRLHALKVWKKYFDALTHPDPKKRKTVEIRKNDRNYRVGDYLWLQEYDPDTDTRGKVITRLVTHILDEQPWLPEGYIAMSIMEDEIKIIF